MTNTKRTKIANITAICLMALLLLLQFTPYWQFEGGSCSILGYVYMPRDHADFAAWVETQTGAPANPNDIVTGPIFLFFLLVAGIVLCVIKNEHWVGGLLPIAAGATGLWTYMQPIAQLGASFGLHMTLCAAILVVGIVAAIPKLKQEA